MRLKVSVQPHDLSKMLLNLLHDELIGLFDIKSDILILFVFVLVQFATIDMIYYILVCFYKIRIDILVNEF